MGAALGSAEKGSGKLQDWVTCGESINYTSRTSEPVRHQLVVGPVRDDSGEVKELIGVSYVLPKPSLFEVRPVAAASASALLPEDEPMIKHLLVNSETNSILRRACAGMMAPKVTPLSREANRPTLCWRQSKPASVASAPALLAAPTLKRRFGDDSGTGARVSGGASGVLACSKPAAARLRTWAASETDELPMPMETGFVALLESNDMRMKLAAATAQVTNAADGNAIPPMRRPPPMAYGFRFPRLGLPPNAPLLPRRILAVL